VTGPGSGLRVVGLDKSFGGAAVLTGLELTVPTGSLTAILGRSGCGKTTLLRAIAGFVRADAGQIVIGEQVVVDVPRRTYLPPERRRVGYVAQEGALFPHLSVAANIAFGLPRAERRGPRVGQMLELVGMAGLGARMPHELSGGQQQRVALARALAGRPSLVLLDEPFAALDAGLRAAVRGDVQAALAAAGATALLVTHDQDEALSMADQLAVLRDGRLVQAADPHTVYTSPVDAELALFLGDAILLPAVRSGEVLRCALGRLAARTDGYHADGAVTAMVRPEQIRLGPPSAGVLARVVASTYYGHDATVQLQLADGAGTELRLLARLSGTVPPAVGSTVSVAVAGPVLTYPTAERRLDSLHG
jgi:iron(III) transport system ATP-binding protein